MSVTVDNKTFLPDGKIIADGVRAPGAELDVGERILRVAVVYGLEERISSSLAELTRSRGRICIFCDVVENLGEELTTTFYVDGPLCLAGAAGVILRICLSIGKYCLCCIFGMTRHLEKIGERQYKLVSKQKSFHRRALSKRGELIDDADATRLTADIEREMGAKGIGPVVALEEWWGG